MQDNFLLCLTCRIPVNAAQNEGCSPYQLVGSAVVYGALQAQMFFGSAAPYQTLLNFFLLTFQFPLPDVVLDFIRYHLIDFGCIFPEYPGHLTL